MTDPAMTGSASAHAPDGLWRKRWWLLASSVLVVVALGVLDLDVVGSWDWALFLWAVAVGVMTAGCFYGLWTLAIRRGRSSRPAEWARHRRTIYTTLWVSIGVEVGVVASMFDLPWLVIGLAVYVVVLLIAGTVLWSVLRRRLRS